jgi:hypothetical protein
MMADTRQPPIRDHPFTYLLSKEDWWSPSIFCALRNHRALTALYQQQPPSYWAKYRIWMSTIRQESKPWAGQPYTVSFFPSLLLLCLVHKNDRGDKLVISNWTGMNVVHQIKVLWDL